jgi:3-oxoadipate enol-lactonase
MTIRRRCFAAHPPVVAAASTSPHAPTTASVRPTVITVDVDVRGTRIAYDEHGEGPLAVRLHGLTQSRAAEDVLPGVVAPVPGRRLLRYDARGHGRSGRGGGTEAEYTWPELARDLLALLDALGVDGPVGGVGASLGTATLLHAAALAPGRFDRLVLTCPPTAWATRAAQAGTYRAGATFLERRGLAAYLAGAAALPRPPALAAWPDPVPDVPEDLLPTVLRGAAASDLPDPDVIAGIRVPTLVLAWDGDPGHPVSTAERLRALVPGAALEVATTPAELAGWGARAAAFLAA